MMFKNNFIVLVCCSLVLNTQASMVFSKENATIQHNNRPIDFYNNVIKAYQNQEWKTVVGQSDQLLKRFPSSPFSPEANYYRGVAFFNLHDYDMANQALSNYLKNEATPKFFEESIEYKFKIGVKFKEGAKRHLLGLHRLPKVIPAKEEAIEIFDLVITSLPRHDIAAEALYHKASILNTCRDYKLSVDSYQTLIRRFPKHPLAPEGFIGIGKVYLDQAKQEFPDPDILDLAQVNFDKFKESFPGEPRVEVAYKMLREMKNEFAKELFEIGDFFQRTKKEDAAELYFNSLISKYPDTKYAQKASKQVKKIEAKKLEKSKNDKTK